MDTKQSTYRDIQISPRSLFALIQQLNTGWSGERPNDEGSPQPPGPWDPVIRAAVRYMDVFGPHPEPWRDFAFRALARRHPEIFDGPWGGGGPLEKVGLNPQPLPPRWAFFQSLVETMVERLELLEETAAALSNDGEQRGIIIVSGYLSRFLDEFCGTGYRLRFPFPGPRPTWFPEELNDMDRLLIAAHLDQAAQEAYSPVLQEGLMGASAKLLEGVLSKQT